MNPSIAVIAPLLQLRPPERLLVSQQHLICCVLRILELPVQGVGKVFHHCSVVALFADDDPSIRSQDAVHLEEDVSHVTPVWEGGREGGTT